MRGLEVDQGLYLRDAKFSGDVVLFDAKIGGNLELINSDFHTKSASRPRRSVNTCTFRTQYSVGECYYSTQGSVQLSLHAGQASMAHWTARR